jgi:hypothetical protein
MAYSNNQTNPQLCEGLEAGDLTRLIHPEVHIDEFKSKMGADEDIVVLTFKVNGKEPATDLMNFFERGYEWVLDADVSSGEMDDGEYLVFVELERSPAACEHTLKLVEDVLNLTEQKMSEWSFLYRKEKTEYEVTLENLLKIVPNTPAEYEMKFGTGDESEDDLSAMLEAARVPVRRTAPKNDWTESLRVAAGLK